MSQSWSQSLWGPRLERRGRSVRQLQCSIPSTPGTEDRARTLPPHLLHERVRGEWSFIETLRHLGFASAARVGRMVLGDPVPRHPLDLPWDEAPGWEGVPWDTEARPSLDEVLDVRRKRQGDNDEGELRWTSC